MRGWFCGNQLLFLCDSLHIRVCTYLVLLLPSPKNVYTLLNRCRIPSLMDRCGGNPKHFGILNTRKNNIRHFYTLSTVALSFFFFWQQLSTILPCDQHRFSNPSSCIKCTRTKNESKVLFAWIFEVSILTDSYVLYPFMVAAIEDNEWITTNNCRWPKSTPPLRR